MRGPSHVRHPAAEAPDRTSAPPPANDRAAKVATAGGAPLRGPPTVAGTANRDRDTDTRTMRQLPDLRAIAGLAAVIAMLGILVIALARPAPPEARTGTDDTNTEAEAHRADEGGVVGPTHG